MKRKLCKVEADPRRFCGMRGKGDGKKPPARAIHYSTNFPF